MVTVFDELHDAMAVVMKLHNRGCDELKGKMHLDCKKVDASNMAEIVIGVATEVAAYNMLMRVHPTKVDLTKILTFSAAALAKRDNDYSALPLFYAYIDFLDLCYVGTGMTLRSFGESVIYAENLAMLLQKGQWISPFCFFRGIDLSFDKCAIPRVEGLVDVTN